MLLYSYIKQCTLVRMCYIVYLYVYLNAHTFFMYKNKRKGKHPQILSNSDYVITLLVFTLFAFFYLRLKNIVFISTNCRISSACVISYTPPFCPYVKDCLLTLKGW